ncbi:TPA: hypothetical protein NJ968_000632 [Vibrio parahaemolyticus]|nr:hypothetical protein [Vibrio parahaemolyticus]HCG8049895.1 hypothetical protein [Vibrio parahaemolyticus]HCG8065305.1 hypothetical protein [Vibrio parahaemolyticus]HCH0774092.1 hypothetical protein [Vibrio parahaemolyticus]
MNIKEIRASFLQRVRSRTLEEKKARFENLEISALGNLICEKEVFSYISTSYSFSDVTRHKFKVAADIYKNIPMKYTIPLNKTSPNGEVLASLALAA